MATGDSKFIQIAVRGGAALGIVFALDEGGGVWFYDGNFYDHNWNDPEIPDPHGKWRRLPTKRVSPQEPRGPSQSAGEVADAPVPAAHRR